MKTFISVINKYSNANANLKYLLSATLIWAFFFRNDSIFYPKFL